MSQPLSHSDKPSNEKMKAEITALQQNLRWAESKPIPEQSASNLNVNQPASQLPGREPKTEIPALSCKTAATPTRLPPKSRPTLLPKVH